MFLSPTAILKSMNFKMVQRFICKQFKTKSFIRTIKGLRFVHFLSEKLKKMVFPTLRGLIERKKWRYSQPCFVLATLRIASQMRFSANQPKLMKNLMIGYFVRKSPRCLSARPFQSLPNQQFDRLKFRKVTSSVRSIWHLHVSYPWHFKLIFVVLRELLRLAR